MAVGEIFLSAFIQVLFEKLASPEAIKFLRREGLHTTIQKWTEKLETIRDVLDDAEEKQITEAGIKRWLEKLEDLAYDVDDMLDVFATEALSQEQLRELNSVDKQSKSHLHLRIKECGIVSFPEEGFPTNLTLLAILNLKISKPLFDWELHRLTSLRKFEIYGPCPDLVSFPEKEKEKRIILPTSLTKLNIGRFPNLKYLPFNTLQSLTSLGIFDCPKLKSFPKDGLSLSSLENLWIIDCPKLKSFPKEGLPLSLLELHIRSCPQLERRCKKDKGGDWPKFAHIPYVEIDWRFIYESPEIAE